jgi:hypothetical protein
VKRINLLLMILAILSVLVLTSRGVAQELPEMTPDQLAEMTAWQNAATPNEHHQKLAEMEGFWNFTSSWWSAPGAEPMKSLGSAEYKMILGGRYLKETVKSEWMGEEFEGVGYYGYDNIKKTFVSVWFDNMSTGMLMSEGSWDDAGKTFTWIGEYIDVMSGKPKKMRTVTRILGKDKHVDEFFDFTKDGKEFRSMEITYTRK